MLGLHAFSNTNMLKRIYVSLISFSWKTKTVKSSFFCCWVRGLLGILAVKVPYFQETLAKTFSTSEICFKLKIKTSKRCHWRRAGAFLFANTEQISLIVLKFWLLNLIKKFSYPNVNKTKTNDVTSVYLSLRMVPNCKKKNPILFAFLALEFSLFINKFLKKLHLSFLLGHLIS